MCKTKYLIIFSLFFLSPLFSASAAETGPEKVVKQAHAKELEGDYERAQSLYESIIKNYPDYEPALVGLGQVKYWQGNYQGAIDTYAKILKIDPDHVGALVGTGKAYLALGKQRKAQEYFNRAEKLEPNEEEVAAVRPQLEHKTKMEINAGYLTQDMNYASEAQGEYQEIRVTKEKGYGLGLTAVYLNKFSQTGLDTRVYGNYYFFEGTRLDLGLDFSPKTNLFPEVGADFGLAQTVWKITGEVHYNYQNYAQATTQTVRPALFFEPFAFLKIGGGYEYQNLRFGNVRRNLNGGFGEVRVTPVEWFSVYGFYSHIQRGFEAGRRPSPYINYTANVGGGGVVFDLMGGYRLRFDGSYEKRNINEYQATINISAGYLF